MIKVPERIHSGVEEIAEVQPLIENYLMEVYSYLMETLKLPKGHGKHPYFEFKYEELRQLNGATTDGVVNYLKYQDQVVALVIETRTEFNNVNCDFFLNLENLVDISFKD